MPSPSKESDPKPVPKTPGERGAVLAVLPPGPVRDVAEVVVSALPGAAVTGLFILIVGLLNILIVNDTYAAVYLPIGCFLPLVVGVISVLVLDRVRGNARISLARSVATGFLGALMGSVGAVALLTLSGAMNFKPFGPSMSTLPGLFAGAVTLIVLSTGLATLSAILTAVFLTRAEK